MSVRRIIGAGLLLLAIGARGESPNVAFGARGITIGGVRPGTKIAWMAMVRRRVDYHAEVQIIRGVSIATPAGALFIEQLGADVADAVWSIGDIDGGGTSHALPPGYSHSLRPVVISATVAADQFRVTAPSVEVMYIRPKKGVWAFGAHDGAQTDGDGMRDGTITIPLRSLLPYQGNPHQPDRVEAGDIILVIDTHDVRTGRIEIVQ